MEQSVGAITRGQVQLEASGVNWGAVLAGAAAACALTLLLLSLGVGLGFAVVSPWGGGVSASSFQIGTGIYFIVMAMISSALGGYLAGRLRRKWIDLELTEIQFRDTAHGFLSWAVASIIGALLLASPASSAIGGLSGSTVQVGASASQARATIYADQLLRSDNRTDQQSLAETRSELTRLLTANLKDGSDVSVPDREYLTKTVAARTGLSQADAEQRVNTVITRAKTDLDNSREVALKTAIWLTLSLFIGAFCAAAAAWEGGGVRDGTWGKATIRPTTASRT